MREKEKNNFPFGELIRSERKKLKYTQQNFADLGGVTVQTQRNYESGRRAPDTNYLNKLAAAGVDVLKIIEANSEGKTENLSLGQEEVKLLDTFDALSDAGRESISNMASALLVQEIDKGIARYHRKKSKE